MEVDRHRGIDWLGGSCRHFDIPKDALSCEGPRGRGGKYVEDGSCSTATRGAESCFRVST